MDFSAEVTGVASTSSITSFLDDVEKCCGDSKMKIAGIKHIDYAKYDNSIKSDFQEIFVKQCIHYHISSLYDSILNESSIAKDAQGCSQSLKNVLSQSKDLEIPTDKEAL